MKLLVELVQGEVNDVPLEPVAVIGGICRVVLSADLRRVLANNDVSLIVDRALLATRLAARFLGDGVDLLGQSFERCRFQTPPCQHRFDSMTRKHRASGTEFSVWFRADIGRFEVVVEAARDSRVWRTTLCASEAPIYIEDDFPMKDAVMVGDEFVIRDRERRPLARVPVPED